MDIIANLDIIIPCYNSKDTVSNTLDSIKEQVGIKGFKVYLVNDKSEYDYQDEVSKYSEYFNIQEIKLETNLGPGGARREGINNTSSEYIMFIDSDDILYDKYSLKKLYEASLGYDFCISNFILERDGVRVEKKQNLAWLHGKVYRRKFLEDNNISFNNTRANEDNGFNRLVSLLKPKTMKLDEITYVYKDNRNSITRKDNREYKIFGLEGYAYNIKWSIDEALKRGVDSSFVPFLSTSALVCLYYEYLYYMNDNDSNNILEYAKMILPYYLDSEKLPTDSVDKFCKMYEDNMRSESKDVKATISFDEFVNKVVNYEQ